MKYFFTKIIFICTLISSAQELTTIKILVPNKTDEVFIVGNQISLGNWQPDKIKMTKISEFEREITLELKLPAEFKFTRGNWESEAKIEDIENNIKITEKAQLLNFEINEWKNEKKSKGKIKLEYEIKYLISQYYPKEERKLKIFLPKNYNPKEKYPVIYTLDGESMFDLLIQNVSILQDEKKSENNIIPKCIVVGIENTDRVRDLKPNDGNNDEYLLSDFLPKTEIFYKIINEEIIPYIEKNYNVSNYNVLIGHSDSAHFVTNVLMKDNNVFDGIISLSVRDNKKYFENNISKILQSSKRFFLGFGTKDDEFNLLGKRLIQEKNLTSNITAKEYNADHTQLPYTSLFDAIKFMFADYKYYDNLTKKYYNESFNYKELEKNYSKIIKEKYGINAEIGIEIYYLLNKARDENNTFVFNKILDEIDEANIYPLQTRFYASDEFNQNERAKKYLYEMLQSNDELDKANFYSLLNTQYKIFFLEKIKQPKQFIDFITKAIEKWPEYKLEFTYMVLKVANEQSLKIKNWKEMYKYCKNNFMENRYFKIVELENLK